MSNPTQPQYQWGAKPSSNVNVDLLRETTAKTKTSIEFGDFHPLIRRDSQQILTNKVGEKTNKNALKGHFKFHTVIT